MHFIKTRETSTINHPETVLPCPWCLFTRILIVKLNFEYHEPQFHAKCGRCGGKGPTALFEELALFLWNTRGKEDRAEVPNPPKEKKDND